MAEDLPFAKRTPHIRSCGEATIHGVFSPIDYNGHLNHPQNPKREMKTGNIRPYTMKIHTRIIDGRKSQILRNKENLFFDTMNIPPPAPIIPQTLRASTRHSLTPYSYNTYWISHPDPDSDLAGKKNETFHSMSLDTSTSLLDRNQKNAHLLSKYAEIRKNQEQLNEKKKLLEEGSIQRDQASIFCKQAERAKYQAALEARQRIEKIPFFD